MPPLRSLVRLALLAGGAWLLWTAFALDAAWFERHVAGPALFLPPPRWFHPMLRALPAVFGVVLLATAGPLSRLQAGNLARILLAVLLACGVAELRLHRTASSPWRELKLEMKLGEADPRYGWVLTPSRTTRLAAPGAAAVTYAIDAWGDRAADPATEPDPRRPSLVVAGESIAVGHGLPFEETFAARLAAALDLQLVNVAAGGYATDQALLRLADVLPRLSQPVAVVMVVPLLQLERNLQDYRPRLSLENGALHPAPPAQGLLAGLRLRDLLVNELPILREAKLRHALKVTAAELREAASVSRARGAQVLFVVPVLGRGKAGEARPEAQFLRPLFVAQGLPFLLVDLDPGELLPFDGHPDAAASKRIAALIAQALLLARAGRPAANPGGPD